MRIKGDPIIKYRRLLDYKTCKNIMFKKKIV